ncbi:MAG: hypothetical protein IIZ10_09320 [Solobacterium sp.]|nr:hypothetical protein [Solobacterium sp.]
MVREIDDRYPEIARPYEPVKGGKHHKRIKLPPFTALIGTVLLMPLIYYPGTETSQPEPVTPESETVLAASMPEGEPHPRPVSPPAEKPKPSPSPSPEPTLRPAVIVTPVPTPQVTAEPSPVPEEIIVPVPEPVPPPPEPEPEPTPTTTPTPTPETENPPKIRVLDDMEGGPDSDHMMWFVSRGFEVTLNDAMDGTVTVQLYVDEGSGYKSVDGDNGYIEYERTEEEGGKWKDYVLYIFGDVSDSFETVNAKLVMNYTTKDGISGQTESDVFKLAKGRFLSFGNVSRNGKTVTVQITAVSEAGTAESMTLEENELILTVGGEELKFTEPKVRADGQDIFLIYDTGIERHEETPYTIYARFSCDIGGGTVEDYVYKEGTLG